MGSFNLTNFDAAMKHMYPYKKVENMVYQNNPLFSMIPKETHFAGRNATYAIEYGMTSGRSANFATAQNNRSGTKLEDFVVTRVKDYAVVSVDNETLLAADGSEGSLLDVAKAKTDSALHVLSRTMGRDIYRSGTGIVGKTIAASGTYSGTTLELVAGDAVNFEVGMRLKSVATGDGDGGAFRSGVLEVTAVDRDADTLTTNVACTTGIPGITNGDFLYIEGDGANGGSNIKMSGLDAWIPATVTSTSFFGVNRTLDKTRLGGQRSTYSSSVHETIIKAAVKVGREGGRPDAMFVNPTDWAELALDLEGKAAIASTSHNRRYDPNDRKGQFGFSSLSIATPTGMVDVYADHNCPVNLGYLLQMDTWKFKSLGPAPRLLDFDGLKGIRQSNEDGVEYRWGYYGNLLCTAPGFNARITLA